MIGMKDQCFGVEVEMTGLTRRQAAQALANYFGTAPNYVGGGYDKWSVKDPAGKAWSIMSDSSIVTEMKTESGYMAALWPVRAAKGENCAARSWSDIRGCVCGSGCGRPMISS